MGKALKVELFNEAVSALHAFSTITGRDAATVLSDALRTYEWILFEQFRGRHVISMNGDLDKAEELENFVANDEAAKEYFREDFGW